MALDSVSKRLRVKPPSLPFCGKVHFTKRTSHYEMETILDLNLCNQNISKMFLSDILRKMKTKMCSFVSLTRANIDPFSRHFLNDHLSHIILDYLKSYLVTVLGGCCVRCQC
jgi:hypothetical protein